MLKKGLPVTLLSELGKSINFLIMNTGNVFFFGLQSLRLACAGLIRPKIYPRFEVIRQIEIAGARSLPIIMLTSALSGMTLVAQMIPTLQAYGTEVFVSSIVGVTIMRSLGPILTAIVFTSRVGAAYTAEIGSMKVSEEILALETMGISPIGYVIAPRLIAGILSLMALTVVFDFCAFGAAYLISVYQFNIPSQDYINMTLEFLDIGDFAYGILKAMVFSFLLTLIACYKGFHVRGSGAEVGKATMEAVVLCLVIIIFADFVLSLAYNILIEL